MLKLTKEADYGIVVLSCFARWQNERSMLTTRFVAQDTGISFPMVCKILNVLVKKKLLISTRGASGGYRLSREPADINLAQVIAALEGPVALTDCSKEVCDCAIMEQCRVAPHWQKINQAFQATLGAISLENMITTGASNAYPNTIWGEA